MEDLAVALDVAEWIEHPSLVWQAAAALSRAQLAAGDGDAARAAARRAAETIGRIVEQAPEPALRRAFLDWPRVQAALEHAERVR